MFSVKVTEMSHSDINVAVLAGLICTNNENKVADYNTETFISNLIKQGHESVIEHINYTFKIDNITRALLQEIARHRHISLSVKSTRWALKKFVNGFNRKKIEGLDCSACNDKQKEIIAKLENKVDELYSIIDSGVAVNIPNDILKYYITESINTSCVFTVNARELRHIFKLRTSSRALKEFRTLCFEIYKSLPEDHKFMYKDIFINNAEFC